MKKLLLSLLCLLAVGLPALAAEQSFTITFTEKTSDTTAAMTTSTATSAYVDTGAEYISSIAATNNVYGAGIKGLKFSSSSKNGSITWNLSTEGQVNATKIVVSACRWKDTEAATLSLNGLTAQSLTADIADYTFIPTGGQLETIKLDATKRAYVQSITVYYDADSNGVATPSITPGSKEFSEPFTATISCGTEGASIYYTTDGSTPSTSSTLYTDGVDIPAATTTLKAIAVKSGMDDSAVGEAVYTYIDPARFQCANIAEWLTKAVDDQNNAYEITGTVTVSYNAKSGSNQYTYVQDNSGSLLVFQSTNSLTPGQTLTGLSGKYKDYNGLIEMVNSNLTSLTAGTGTSPEPAVMKIAAITSADVNKYVKIEGAEFDPTAKTITQDGSSVAAYYRFDNVTNPTEAGTYDIEGFVCVYNGNLQIYPTKYTEIAQAANISWSSESVNFTWEPNYASKLPTLNNPDNAAVTYSSSNAAIATVDASGAVTLVAPGNCEIHATAGSTTVSYSLTVGVVNMSAQGLISWEGTTNNGFTATIGANNNFPTIKVAEGYNLIGTVYDAFGDAPEEGYEGKVATINYNGEITLVNPGTCYIGYIWGPANPFIGADNFNYYLTVLPAAASNVSWSATSAQVTFNSAGNYTLPTLDNPDNVAVTYSSSDVNVATIDATGKVTVLKPGSTTIKATYDTDKEATYALVVDKIHFTVTFSGLTDGQFTAVMGQANNYPTYTVEPAAEKDQYWFGVVYNSSNTDVATVAPDGTVTLNGVGQTEIRIINGGNDYVMGDNYPAYTLNVVVGDTDLKEPVIEAYMSTDFEAIENGGSIQQSDAPVYISVENPNDDTTMTVYVMKAPSIDEIDSLDEFESVEEFSGKTWNANKFPKDPGFYYITAMVFNADYSKDSYAEFMFTIEGDAVKTYVNPIVDFTDADGNPLTGTSGDAPVIFSIENQNPSGSNSSIYYFITTSSNDPEYIKSDSDVSVTIDSPGTYRYSAYIASYEGDKLTGTSETVSGTFTVNIAPLKEAIFMAVDKTGAEVAMGSTVAEENAPVSVTITNPNADSSMEISVANLSTGDSQDYSTSESTYTITFDKSGEHAIGAFIMKNDQDAYSEFYFTIDGEIEYSLTAPYVEFLDDDYNEVPSPATSLPVNMTISHQNYIEGAQMVYTINGETTTTDEREVVIALTEPGTLTYSVYVKVGTKSVSETVSGTYEVTADAVKLAAPVINFSTPEGEIEPVTVTITNPNLGGIGTLFYSIGTSAWFEAEGATVTFTLPSDGVYTIRAYVRNNNDETLNSDITTAEYTLDGIESVNFGNDGVKVVGGHIMAPEGTEVYSISGLRVNTLDRVAPGIYIVRLANGTTTKVIVK